jgi:PEP-CTERM motif
VSLVRVLCGLLLAAALSGPALAGANLVTNGGFELDSLTPNTGGDTSFQIGSYSYNSTSYTGAATDWTVSAGDYNFIFTSGTASPLTQYGPFTLAQGSAIGNSPAGGNFLVSDGDTNSGSISQTINGLTVGVKTTLTFYWGAAQQSNYTGPTTQSWQVSLGSSTQDTSTYSLASDAFSGWMQATMTFIPTSTSEVLSFLAVATGSPPMLLLDGVTLATPEPGTWAIMLTGLLGLAFVMRRRRKALRAEG